MSFSQNHTAIKVTDIGKSVSFYQNAFGLTEQKRIESEEYLLVFIGNERSDNLIELMCYHNHPGKYDLGENPVHIALYADDYKTVKEKHKRAGIITEDGGGLYMVVDPDGYRIEVISSV